MIQLKGKNLLKNVNTFFKLLQFINKFMEVKVSNYTEIYINLQKKILKKMLKFNLMSMTKLVEIKKKILKNETTAQIYYHKRN